MFILLSVLGLWTAACQPQRQHEHTTTSAPSSQAAVHSVAASQPTASVWEKSSKGVRLAYPAGWLPKKNPDYELMLIPSGATADDPRITFDIPDLPPHMPWMIQMSRIERDYLADLKKTHPDLKLEDAADTHIPNATARLVRSTWHEGSIGHEDVVLLMIHASAVYILDARADAQHLSQTRASFDSIESSLQWTKYISLSCSALPAESGVERPWRVRSPAASLPARPVPTRSRHRPTAPPPLSPAVRREAPGRPPLRASWGARRQPACAGPMARRKLRSHARQLHA
jgi:hypothetical protein